MSRSTHAEGEAATTGDSASVPVLLYDASCTMCNDLAYKVRDRADEPLRLVSLSDPEADELLAPHYSDSWSEDFYFVNGDTARKGKRALPSVMKTVGVKDFAALLGDYLRHHQSQSQGDDCDHDHDHDDSRSTGVLSRRNFVGAAATVGTALFANPVQGASSRDRPPKGLAVRVARVRPDGQGSYDVTIEREDELVRQERWEPSSQVESTQSTTKQKPVSMDSTGTKTLLDRGTLQVQREDVDLTLETDDDVLEAAFDMNRAGQSRGAQMTRYGVLDDRDRYGFSLNFAKGPMKVDGKAKDGSTLSGRINHDVARKTVDFVKFESEESADIETHLEGYVAAIRAYQRHYADSGDAKMARLYGEIAADLDGNVSTIPAAAEDEFEPVKNVLSISSVPYWTEYVESPTTDGSDVYQTSDVSGADCGCSCCSLGCCTGCDCGCSICIGTPKPGCGCGCCIGGCGAGCGCGCCYCID
ncbi:hypothetical protein [Natribaculum luteum]|nr:hypothetical protein [Natribaculum luteum]